MRGEFMRRLILGWLLLTAASVPAAGGEEPVLKSLVSIEPVGLLGDARLRHASDISHIEPLADGKRALSTSRDGSIRLWELETGKELQRYLPSAGDDVWNVKLLPGETEFLSCGDDLHVTRWNLETGEVLAKYKLPATGMRLAIVPGGKQFIACDSGRHASLWDIATGDREVVYKGHTESVYSAAASPAGTICVTCSEDGTVRGWELASGKKLWVVEKEVPEEEEDPRFGADPFGAVEPPEEEEPAEGKAKKELGPGHLEDVFTVCFLPDGKHVVSCSEDSAVSLWNAADGKQVWSESVSSSAKVVTCSPHGETLAVTSDDGTIHLLSAKDGSLVRVIKAPGSEHWAVAFSPDGKRILTGGDSMIYQWNAATGEQLFPPPKSEYVKGSISKIAVSPDGKTLYALAGDFVHVWNVGTREQIARWPVPGEVDDIEAIGCSEVGDMLWLLGEKTVALNTKSGKVTQSIANENNLESAKFTADGKLMIALFWNGQVKGWSTTSGKEVFSTPAHSDGNDADDMAVGDGQHVAVVGKRLIEVRNVTNGNSVLQIPRTAELSVRSTVLLAGDQGLLLMGELNDQPRLIPIIPSVARNPRRLPPKQIDLLVSQLGDEQFSRRESAMNALIAGGEQVLSQLEAASDDTEVRWRLAKIRDRVREGLLPNSVLKEIELEAETRDAAAHPTLPVWAMVARYDCRATLQLGSVAGQRVLLADATCDGHSPACVTFSPDGEHLFTGNRDGTVSVFAVK